VYTMKERATRDTMEEKAQNREAFALVLRNSVSGHGSFAWSSEVGRKGPRKSTL